MTAQVTKIAIIGGGVAGLYCAYRLLDRDYEVTLYEATSRLGGRIYTGKFEFDLQPMSRMMLGTTLGPAQLNEAGGGSTSGGPMKDRFLPEYGPMRIEPEHQELLQGLLNELKIKSIEDPDTDAAARLINFPAYASPLSEFAPAYPLSGEEAEQKTPLDLMKLGFVRILGRLTFLEPASPEAAPQRAYFKDRVEKALDALKLAAATRQPDWKSVLQRSIDTLHEEDFENLRDYAAFDYSPSCKPTPLYQMGFWNLLSEVLSHNAVIKLRDIGTFYHLLGENPNAAEWLIFWLRGLLTTERLQGIDEGMEEIINLMRKKIEHRRSNSIKTAHKLTLIAPNNDKVMLGFNDGDASVEVDHVILAIPKAPLEKLVLMNVRHFPDQVRTHIDAVFGFPLVKVFAVVKHRWWEEDQRANVGATSIPTRELHYWKSRTPGSTRGMVMIYTDRPSSAFWANYVGATGEQAIPDSPAGSGADLFRQGQSERLKHKIVQVLREAGAKTLREGDIEDFGIMDWGRAPHGGAAHAWRPERKSSEVLKALSSFVLEKSTRDKDDGNIHICGEAYSDYQAFIEGSLRSAVHVLHLIDTAGKRKTGQANTGKGDSDKTEIATMTPWLCADRGPDHESCKHDDRRSVRRASRTTRRQSTRPG